MNNKSLEKMYSDHEKERNTKIFRETQENKRMFNSRVIQIEQGQSTPLVFSRTGGRAKECSCFLKKLSEKLSHKTNQNARQSTPSGAHQLITGVFCCCVLPCVAPRTSRAGAAASRQQVRQRLTRCFYSRD